MQRTEAETWYIVQECFDTFFLVDRINCLCDLIIYLAFTKNSILTYAERDILLDRLERYRKKKNINKNSPFWAYGEIEPRKEFINNIIKFLDNEKDRKHLADGY